MLLWVSCEVRSSGIHIYTGAIMQYIHVHWILIYNCIPSIFLRTLQINLKKHLINIWQKAFFKQYIYIISCSFNNCLLIKYHVVAMCSILVTKLKICFKTIYLDKCSRTYFLKNNRSLTNDSIILSGPFMVPFKYQFAWTKCQSSTWSLKNIEYKELDSQLRTVHVIFNAEG